MYAAGRGNSAKAEAVRHVGKHAGNRPPVEAAVSRIQRSGEAVNPTIQVAKRMLKDHANFLMKAAMSKDIPGT